MQYEIYSDESGYGEDRFEAIGTLSVKLGSTKNLQDKLKAILNSYNIKYLEYKKIRDERRFKCACEIIELIFSFVLCGDVKILVLVWDKHDSRHKVMNRNDLKNISIMYYHALKNTKRLWFDSGIDSSFYPDELSKIDFLNIIKYLENGRLRKESMVKETLFGIEFKNLFPKIINHEEVNSKNNYLIQVVDIFTGIVRLSHEEFDGYEHWKKQSTPQNGLFGGDFWGDSNFSNSKIYKYKLIDYINDFCKDNSLQVALNTTKSFYSHRPSCGVWFWKYVPQRPGDKAPVR